MSNPSIGDARHRRAGEANDEHAVLRHIASPRVTSQRPVVGMTEARVTRINGVSVS